MLSWIEGYRKKDLRADLFAGLTIGVMLIPQGMSYALIAGLPPQYGLYTALIPPIVYALLGTSRQLSVGPVALDSLLIAAGVSAIAMQNTDEYLAYVLIVTFLVGSMQVLFGFLKLGFITNLLSKPVISGFTSAAAIIIAMSQLHHLMGLSHALKGGFTEIISNLLQDSVDPDGSTLLLGLASILFLVFLKKYRTLPSALLLIIWSTSIVYFLGLQESGIAIVGDIPSGLPSLTFPDWSVAKVSEVWVLALALVLVGFVESFSIAKNFEAKHPNHKINPNKELVALGFANLVGSVFQSFPASAGFSRSAVNEMAGAKTLLSGVIASVMVGLVLLFFTPLFFFLPMTALAAIVMVAASNLLNISYAKRLWRESKSEFTVLILTFAGTLSAGIMVGLGLGVISSIILLLYRAAYPHTAILGKVSGVNEYRNTLRFSQLETWDTLKIIRIDAPLSFINVQEVKDKLLNIGEDQKKLKALVVDAAPISHIDASAVESLLAIQKELSDRKIRLVFCEVIGPVRDIMQKSGLIQKVGEENFFLNVSEAVESLLGNEPDEHKEITLQTNIRA